MLLINPPVVRACEPPLGVARLAALLRGCGVPVRALDLCAEGFAWLLSREAAPEAVPDSRTRLALRRVDANLLALRSSDGYASPERHGRAVNELQRALGAVSAVRSPSAVVSLADYGDAVLSPLRKADLAAAAARCEENPFYPFFAERIDAVLSERGSRTVGLSVNFLSQALCAFAIVGFLKRTRPETRIVLGGGLITSWLAQGRLTASETFGGLVSALIPGDAEDALPAFLGVSRNGASPAPDFSDFSGIRYFAPGLILPYNFSYGCPWRRCVFCPEKAEGGAYKGARTDAAVAQVRALAERHDPVLLHFTDNEIGPAYLRALARTPPGVPWYGFARFSRELLDPGLCRALASSGCRMLQLGLESGSQAVLDALDKGTRLAEIDRILANLKAAGIGVYAYLLFGTPAEDRRSAEETRVFVAARADLIDFLNIAVFNLPLASPEAASLRTRPFYDGDLSLYAEFEHPSGWHRSAVRAYLRKEFEADPLIRPIVLRNPSAFTSSHAPFFLP